MWMQLIFVFLIGVLAGICFVVTGLWYVLSIFLHDPDDKKSGQAIPAPATSATFQLPPVLLSKISDESYKSKESCWAVNFILYFLFRELKNSEGVRRWVLRKLALEFDELLSTSILGKIFSNITIQNIDLGQNFPVVNWVRTMKVELHPVFKSISTLDILVDLDYSGGFQFSIKAETHLKHSAFLSVQINEVKGQARLEFSSEPYPHWSFSFIDNPEIDISVVSQLYGKSISQVTTVIASQLKRSVKKKHTLPMYKIRYKPFFSRIQPFVAACVPNAAPRIETTGFLTITVVECRGLMQKLLRGTVFASLGIGNFDWVAAYEDTAKQLFVIRDVGYIKTAKRERELDFRLMQRGDVPVVESVESESPTSVPRAIRNVMNMVSFSPNGCILEPGDEIIAVDGKRVSTIKHCIKYFRNSSSVRVIFRIRRRCLNPSSENGEVSLGEDALENLGNRDGLVAAGSSLHTDGSHSQNSSRRNSFSESADNLSVAIHPISTDKVEHIYKTSSLPACRDPIFQESFVFTLDEAQQFINVGCWSSDNANSSDGSNTSSPNDSPLKKKARQRRPSTPTLPFGHDSLVGSLCIPLSDVVSECCTTGMGFFVKDFYFGPPDGNVAADARDNELKNHSGFEPTMCYGKVTLSFHFKAIDDSRRKASEESSAGGVVTSDVGNAEALFVEQSQLSPSDEPQGHRFVRTHFKSSAVCDYCNKKIWLKEAYVCALCNMKCHKKCNERCVANTVCRSEMYQNRRQANPEIITTYSDPNEINRNGAATPEESSQPSGSVSVRRRTLGGLLVSAVQGKTAQLKRAGSATTLLPPATSCNSAAGSKSLPPSPETSPATSRKASVSTGQSHGGGGSCVNNPFQSIDESCVGQISREVLNCAVEKLMKYEGDDMVSLAKETGHNLFANHPPDLRKELITAVLHQVQQEIDALNSKQKSWAKEQSVKKIGRSEAKIEALTSLMLHCCSALQHVQELEDGNKDGHPIILSDAEGETPIVIETEDIDLMSSQETHIEPILATFQSS